jgi:hypothetical protein
LSLIASPRPTAVSEALRNATAARDAGDYDSAIGHLRSAYASAVSAGLGLDAAECLRLPSYLQRSGRSQEAWAELQSLLSPDHPVLRYGKGDAPINHYHIYDKMRLFLQRERKPAFAACYSVLSYLNLAENWHVVIADLRAHRISTRSTRERLREFGTSEAIEQALVRDLRRANLLDTLPQLTLWIQRTLKARPIAAPQVLLDQVRVILGTTESYP